MIQFKYNQDNLELMSLDRELETDEIHKVNDFYGQANIIRRYANYKRPIKVIYEHSIVIHDLIWSIDKESNLNTCFVSSEHRLDVYKKQLKEKHVYNIGSVLNYAIAMSDPQFAKNNFKSNKKKSGSIFFPTHSTHHIKSTIDSDYIITKLKLLPEMYLPITICMYWKDIQHGEHLKYLSNGFKVVSAGHIYDNLFYFRLFDIFQNFKYTLGSSFGSFVFHAARSGSLVVFPKELRIKNEEISISTENFEDKDLLERIEIGRKFDEKFFELFTHNIEVYNKEQIKFIEYYSDSKLLSPQKLKIVLLFAEFIYFKNRVINKIKSILKK